MATAPAIAAVAAPESTGTPKLTLHLTTGTGTENRTYLLLAGGPPPAHEALLLDEEGLHAVRAVVTSDAGRSCTTDAPRRTGLGEDPWCVRLSGIAAGNSVSGKLAGPSSTVALALTARHAIWWPLLAAFVALVCAGFIAWLAQRWLPDAVTKLLLWNEKKRCKEIVGLTDWADQAAQGRLALTDIVARLRWARRFGRRQIRAAREDLRLKLGDGDLPSCPLRTSSETESGRTDVKREDLLTDGGARANGAGEHLLQLVEQALEGLKEFRNVAGALIGQLPADATTERARAEENKTKGEGLAENYLSEFTIDAYLSELRGYLATIERIVRPATAGLTPTVVAAPALFGAAVRASLTAAGQRLRSGSATLARTSVVLGTLLLLTGSLMFVAAGAVLMAQYLPNLTFGTFKDYATLVVAAFGSAQVAVILVALLQLKGPADWYG
ncbi:hypothetical protein [Streptomyces sp. WAC01526]|uniref:hypothetical protein n=1 Tax=Streptomyces sp. WAC01526 TaxID=2588709 RepID=UPI0011DF0C71|nr:hypothetical protein [Streptomyces sp. WAC01526]